MKSIKLVIAKKEIDFHFGLGFLGDLLDSLDLSIEELMKGLQKNPFKILPKIMHQAATYSSVRKGEEFDLSIHELTDLIDDDGGIVSESVSKFLEAFTQSMSKDVPKQPKKIGQEKKKKAVLQK